MKMMKRLFRNVSRSWDKLPKEKPVVSLSKGSGVHGLVTVEGNQIHFHSLPFRSTLPSKQSIVLEDLTLQELVDTVQSMGYDAKITSEGAEYKDLQSFTLMPVRNANVLGGTALTIFTSKLWQTLYPIARLLEETEDDMDKAVAQMFVTSASGKWLDYWASFFRINRKTGEDDNTLARRIFMTIMNLKTNNMAIEELVRFVLKTEAEVNDIEPALFEVRVEPEYIAYSDTVYQIVDSVKGAGIAYILHYMKTWAENYQNSISDRDGVNFRESDKHSEEIDWFNREQRFGYTPWEEHPEFRLNFHELNTTEMLDTPERINDNPDTYTVNVDYGLQTEEYDRLHYTGVPIELNSYELNSTGDEVFYGKYHETAQLFGTAVFQNEEGIPQTSEDLGGESIAPFVEHTFKWRYAGESLENNEGDTNSDTMLYYENRLADTVSSWDIVMTAFAEVYNEWSDSLTGDVLMPENAELYDSASEDLGGENLYQLTELSYKYKQKQEEELHNNEDNTNEGKLTFSYEDRMFDESVFDIAFNAMEVFEVNRNQPTYEPAFELNFGSLNDASLYGVETYGDIMDSITVESAETFPYPAESVGGSSDLTYTEHYEDPKVLGAFGFVLNATSLVDGSGKLSLKDGRYTEGGSMEMVDSNGIVVQSMTL